MQAYRVETTIASDGSVTVTQVPLPAGETVEVIILVQERKKHSDHRYPLYNKPVLYTEPFHSVAEQDWDVQL